MSTKIDWSLCRHSPYPHQIEGVEKLLQHAFFYLTDEMGIGKSKQVIDTFCFLFQERQIDKVIIVANSVPAWQVWFDEKIGELSIHLWDSLYSLVQFYHNKTARWSYGEPKERPLRIAVANYEFLRRGNNVDELAAWCDRRTYLVVDEASEIKSFKAKQTKAVWKLRDKLRIPTLLKAPVENCGRVALLNGTPITHSIGDLYSQGRALHPGILGCSNWWVYRARYAVMGGWKGKQILRWVGTEDIQQRFAPYVLRRLKEDNLNLPPKLPALPLEVPLEETTWAMYKEMRREMITWLSNSSAATSSVAAVTPMRLAQIVCGFVGGVEEIFTEDEVLEEDLEDDETLEHKEIEVKHISNEKLIFLQWWLIKEWERNKNAKIIIWTRFRPELEKILTLLKGLHLEGDLEHYGAIYGDQDVLERREAVRLMHPKTTPRGATAIVGITSAGSMGINLSASHTVIRMSSDRSLRTRLQSEDRCHRPGQVSPVSYYDILATGPEGQRTVDHTILKGLLQSELRANWTANAWVKELQMDIEQEEEDLELVF